MSGARYIARLKRLRSVPGRGRIVAALRDSDDPYLSEVHQKVAERMSLCMCGATVMGEADGSRVAVGPHHCDASVCDRCHKHRRRGSYQTLLGLCQEAQRQDLLLLLVTVTFPRDPSPVAPQLADLWSAYEQLRSHEAWEPVQGAAATLEVTYRQEGARCRAGQLCKRGCRGCGRTLAHGWLPHLHIVAASESRIEWPDLGPVWEEVTEGRASIVHVRALVGDQAAEDGLQEALKYPLKGVRRMGADEIVEWVNAIRRRQLTRRHGAFHASSSEYLRPPEREAEEPLPVQVDLYSLSAAATQGFEAHGQIRGATGEWEDVIMTAEATAAAWSAAAAWLSDAEERARERAERARARTAAWRSAQRARQATGGPSEQPRGAGDG